MDTTPEGRLLWHEDVGNGDKPPLLLLHGWGCDASFLEHQAVHFARSRRVVSVDLPGHGRSAGIGDTTSVAGMSAAVAAVCDDAGLSGAVVVGHSMGGTVALELAHRHPAAVSAIVLIDTVIFPSPAMTQAMAGLADLLDSGDTSAAIRQACAALSLPIDDPAAAARYEASLTAMSPATMASTFKAGHLDYRPEQALANYGKPLAYIGSETPFADVGRLASACSQVKVGQVLGSGHFAPTLVPDQVNDMIAGFLRGYVDGANGDAG